MRKVERKMKPIEELYNGTLLPIEQFGYSDSQEWKVIHNEILNEEKGLLENLNEEQKKSYIKIKELKNRAEGLEQSRMFHFAFRLGCRIIIDIYN